METKKFKYKGDDKRPAQSPVRKHLGISALKASLLRGKDLVNGGACIMNEPLTWGQYRTLLDKAVLMYDARPDMEWKHRWGMVQIRIMQAMTNPVIFFR